MILTSARQRNLRTFTLSISKPWRRGSNSIEGTQVPAGDYKLSFVFGFTDTENVDGGYPDLNTASFNVPAMLGGGYHFMQFDGKYAAQSLPPAAI